MTFVYIGLTVLSLGLMIFVHELGHAYAMRRNNIPIEEIGLGVKFRPYITIHSTFFDCPMYFSPWIVMGYVKSSEAADAQMKTLGRREQLSIYGSGIWANVMYGLAALYVLWFLGEQAFSLRGLLMLTALVSVTALLYWGKDFFTTYIFPMLSVGVLVLVGSMLFGPSASEGVSGPVGIISVVADNSANIQDVLRLSFALSWSIGLLQALPLLPFDGGHGIAALLPRRFRRTYEVMTGYIGALFIAWVFISDFI